MDFERTHDETIALAREAVRRLSPRRAEGFDDWSKVGMVLHWVGDELLPDFVAFSQLCPEKFDERACLTRWRGFRRNRGSRTIKLGTLIRWAEGDSGIPVSHWGIARTPRPRVTRHIRHIVAETPPRDFTPEAQTAHRFALEQNLLPALAEQLGVPVDALARLRTGWHEERGCWTAPMRTGSGRVCGLHFRTDRGRKFALRGSRSGLFAERAVFDKRIGDVLTVVEGFSDVVAALALGARAVVGRPGCEQCAAQVVALQRRMRYPSVVIVPDLDHAGLVGAEKLRKALIAHARRVTLARLPEGVKDVRAWLAAGASNDDWMALVGTHEATVSW